MDFWRGGFLPDLLLIVALIAVAAQLRRRFPILSRMGVPDALLAGVIGMALGPGGADVLPFDAENLKLVVYHGLAIIFITVALQSPPKGKSVGARSLAFAIPSMAVTQAILGLSLVLAWNVVQGDPHALHPGTGLMVPLGFSQGPGPAMVFGRTWSESAGMVDGAQIGLIMAALGFAWCTIGGVALIAVGRRRGWDRVAASEADRAGEAERPAARTAKLGELEPLSAQFITIAIVYLVTYLFLENVTPHLPEKHRPTLWGFHFLLALGFGLATRGVLSRTGDANPLDDDLLSRMSSLAVDLATACALAAVQLAVLGRWLVPLLTISAVAGFTTLVLSVWLARRAFPQAPLQHAVMLFGAQTGTATTGLALLRMLDPELRGPTARNFVLASAGAAVFGLPLFIMMQKPVTGWPDTYPGAPLLTLGLLALYLVLIVSAWRRVGPLRFLGPLRSPWPHRD